MCMCRTKALADKLRYPPSTYARPHTRTSAHQAEEYLAVITRAGSQPGTRSGRKPRRSTKAYVLATVEPRPTNDLAVDIACVQESPDRCVLSEGLSYRAGAAVAPDAGRRPIRWRAASGSGAVQLSSMPVGERGLLAPAELWPQERQLFTQGSRGWGA
jgi:hypothetical protein